MKRSLVLMLIQVLMLVLSGCGGDDSDTGGGGSAGAGGGGGTGAAGGAGGSIVPGCGDGSCSAADGEDCQSCPADCGACPAPACGDPSGDTGEDCSTCGGGSCGAYWVAPAGSDAGDGSYDSPWASISHALASVPPAGGATICVAAGVYSETVVAEESYGERVWVKSVSPYQAVLTAPDNPVLDIGSRNLTIEGFEIAGSEGTGPSSGLVYLWEAESTTLRNNIIHDSYDNDLVRVLASHNTVIECSALYNQHAQEELIDINSGSRDTYLRDNIFFSAFAQSGHTLADPIQSFIVIKNSGGADPPTGSVFLQRNVFMHYEEGGHPHLRIGADGEQYREAVNIWVENNLFLYNGAPMNGAFTVLNAYDVKFRSNTFVGNATDDPFAGYVGTGEGSPPSDAVFFYNNVFSRPDGQMEELIRSPASDVTSGEIRTNLYFNGGNALPAPGEVFDAGNDPEALMADPQLTDPAAAVTPFWDGTVLGSGWTSVRQAFESLVSDFGAPPLGSVVVDAANPEQSPPDDILGRARGTAPDLGAFETAP